MSGCVRRCSIFCVHSSCLPACFHAYRPAFLPWCMYICLPAFLSVPQVLWDCHKVLITHMTSPTSCLPCILGLSGLKNPFTRLPLFSPSSHCCPPLSSLLSSNFPGLSLVVLYRFAPIRSVNRNCWLLASAGITERLVARFSRLCLVTTPALPPPLSLVNRVLYHQLYRASSHCV